MSRINCVRSITRTSRSFSRFRCWLGESSWSKITRSESRPWTAVLSSSALPEPRKVEESAASRTWEMVERTLAPALTARLLSSSNESLAEKVAEKSCEVGRGFLPLISNPTRMARSSAVRRPNLPASRHLRLRRQRLGHRVRTDELDCGDRLYEQVWQLQLLILRA